MGWAFNLAVKTLIKMLMSLSGVTGFSRQLQLLTPASCIPGKQQVMAQVAEFLPLNWETWTEFPTPALAGEFGEKPVDGSILSICLSLGLSDS